MHTSLLLGARCPIFIIHPRSISHKPISVHGAAQRTTTLSSTSSLTISISKQQKQAFRWRATPEMHIPLPGTIDFKVRYFSYVFSSRERGRQAVSTSASIVASI
jgi:hypothetical protein